MKGWRRAVGLTPLVGLFVALIVVVSYDPALARQIPACMGRQPWTAPGNVAGEPPLAEAPAPPQTPDSPAPPFVAPPPNPLAPDESVPFGGIPFVGPEPMEPMVPLVRLRVRAAAEVQPGKEIEYQLTVENVSRAAAHHVIVRDRLPRGTDFVRAKPEPTSKTPAKKGVTDLLWDFGTVKPGEQKVIVLAINPGETDEVQNSAYVQFEHGQTVMTRIAKPSVSLRVVAPAQSVLPDPISFRLEVTNTGSLPAKDVALKDELPEGLVFGNSKPLLSGGDKPLMWKLGTLKPGEKKVVEYQAIAAQAGTFTNKAEVTAEGGVRHKASVTVTVGEAKLSLLKTGPQRRLINRPTPYHITVSNPGTMPATNVQVIDELSPGVHFVSASPGGHFTDAHVRWSLGTLRPGEQRSLQVILLAPRPGRFGNMVQAKADHDVTAKVRADETHFETPSGPSVEIDKIADPLEVGQKATYTIRLINPGTTPFLNPIVTVTVPEAMTVRGERGPTTAKREGQIVRFDPLPALDAGAEVLYTVEAEAKKVGEARLRVELTEKREDSGSPQRWEEKTIIREAPRLAPQSAPPTLQVRQTHRR